MSIPFKYVSLARMEKRGRNQFILPRHTAKLSILPSPFGMPLQNFIWEHKIYYCTCKSICLISHQRTDPTVEYSRKKWGCCKAAPFCNNQNGKSINTLPNSNHSASTQEPRGTSTAPSPVRCHPEAVLHANKAR